MSDKKYIVPDGMLKAAGGALDQEQENFRQWLKGNRTIVPGENGYPLLVMLRAALRWQSENLIVPTEEDLDDIMQSDPTGHVWDRDSLRYGASQFQCRMYLAGGPQANIAQETPMVITAPCGGRYAIGMDFGQASDESVAVIMRIGENGEPDEVVETLRRDKVTGRWISDTAEPEPPEEIKDLLWDSIPVADEHDDPVSLHNTFILAAFLRGHDRRP